MTRRLPLPVIVFVALATGLVAAGAVTYRHYAAALVSEAHAEMTAVARLKAKMLADWRDDRAASARLLAERRRLSTLARGRDRSVVPRVTRLLSRFAEANRCADALLADTAGDVLASASGRSGRLTGPERAVISAAARDGGAAFSPVLPTPLGDAFYVAVTVPPTGAPVGFLLVAMRPQDEVVSLVSGWPVPSATGGGAIVQRDGRSVVVLGDGAIGASARTGHGSGQLRTALDAPTVVDDEDERGVPVLRAAAPVPGLPWSVVAWKQRAEIMAAPRRAAAGLAITVAALVLAAAGVVTTAWSRRAADALSRQRELERRIHERHLELVTRFGNDIVLVIDSDLRIVDANDRAADTYGYPAPDLRSMHARRLRAPEAAASFDTDHARMHRDRGHVFETVHVRRDGSRLPVEVSGRAFELEPGGATYFHVIIRDLSERRRAEAVLAAAERAAAAGALAAGAAHRLNNPLASILANVRFATEQLSVPGDCADRPEVLHALDDIRESAERVRAVARSLRSFDAGAVAVLEDCDLAACASDAIREHEARSSVLHLEADLRPAFVRAQPLALQRIVHELLANAVQAVAAMAPPDRRIALVTRQDLTGRAVLEVRDNGAGMTADVKARAHDPFFTARAGTSAEGIGLFVCHGLVTTLGGVIEVESEHGRGSTFRALFPGAQAPAEPAPPGPASAHG